MKYKNHVFDSMRGYKQGIMIKYCSKCELTIT